MQLTDEARYTGTVNSSMQPEGRGSFKTYFVLSGYGFEGGYSSHYDGDFKDGKFDGWGVYTLASGARYTGEFKHGKQDGFGTYVWPNGDMYVGEWQGCSRHGVGTMVTSKGLWREHCGLWKFDKSC